MCCSRSRLQHSCCCPPSTAASTPNPIVGHDRGLAPVRRLGCTGDWQPDCAATHLAYDAGDDVWQGTFSLPGRELRVQGRAQRLVGRELRPPRAVRTASNIPLDLPPARAVKFYYDHKTHWITDNQSSVDRRSRRGASSPSSAARATGIRAACARGSQDPTATASTRSRRRRCPQGSYEAKVAINESWDENYGAGGVPERRRTSRSRVPFDNAKVTFSYDAATHVLTIARAAPTTATSSHFDLARKDCLGTARNTTSKVWYTVANGVLSDVYYPTVDNTNVETLQYVVTDGSTFTDLQTRDMTYTVEAAPRHRRHGVQRHRDREERQVPDRDRLHHRPEPQHGADARRVRRRKTPAYRLYVRFDPTVNGNGGGGAGNGGADSATVDASTGHPVLVSYDTDHGDERGEPRLRAAGLRGARRPARGRRRAAFVGVGRRLDRHSHDHADARGRQRRPARARARSAATARRCSRSASAPTQAEAVGAAEGSLGASFDEALDEYEKGWKRLRRLAEQAAARS